MTAGGDSVGFRMAEMLIVHFCHSVAGIIGSINNASDLLMSADALISKQAADIVESNSLEAIRRLRIFRKTYGLTELGNDEISLQDYCQDVFQYLAGKGIKLVLVGCSDGYLLSYKAKILVNVALLFCDVLHVGSEVQIIAVDKSYDEFIVRGYSPDNFVRDAAIFLTLTQSVSSKATDKSEDSMNIDNIQAIYLLELLKFCGTSVEVERGNNQVSCAISFPGAEDV